MGDLQNYVTYTDAGKLDGAYQQVPAAEHIDHMIFVDEAVRLNWTLYRANAARDGVEINPPVPPADVDLVALKSVKNDAINAARALANLSTFPHAGKEIACDALSRSDIDGVANNIALFGAFPTGFPGAWKAVDNTLVPLPDVAAFRAMYASMTAQGTENFNHAQALKARLANASTPDQVAAIEW